MTKLDRIALRIVTVIIILGVLAWAISSLVYPIAPTQRATYHNITKVEVNYPHSITDAVYTSDYDSKTVSAIVNDLNSQSYGPWRQSLGGKEGASVVSINLYHSNEHGGSIAASFSLYPELLMERAENYRQLNAQGITRYIDIRELPALQAIWCDSRNTDDYNRSQRIQYCSNYPSKTLGAN